MAAEHLRFLHGLQRGYQNQLRNHHCDKCSFPSDRQCAACTESFCVPHHKNNDYHSDNWQGVFGNAQDQLCQHCSSKYPPQVDVNRGLVRFEQSPVHLQLALMHSPGERTYVEHKQLWLGARSISMNASCFCLHLNHRVLALQPLPVSVLTCPKCCLPV